MAKVMTMDIAEEVMAVIQTIIDRLAINSKEQIKLQGIGVGPTARPLPTNDQYSKIIIPGDTYEYALHNLYLVLWDLAIEVGIPDEKRELLRNLF